MYVPRSIALDGNDALVCSDGEKTAGILHSAYFRLHTHGSGVVRVS